MGLITYIINEKKLYLYAVNHSSLMHFWCYKLSQASYNSNLCSLFSMMLRDVHDVVTDNDAYIYNSIYMSYIKQLFMMFKRAWFSFSYREISVITKTVVSRKTSQTRTLNPEVDGLQ